LLLAIPFLTILKKNLLFLSIGAFFLQSTIPATTVLVLQLIRRNPAIAISLSFGFSILVAGVLFYTPVIQYINHNSAILIAILVSIILLWVLLKRQNRNQESKTTTEPPH